jgi:hypothetical protein
LSRRFEAYGLNKRIEIVDDPVIEPVELRSFFTMEPGIAADRAEKARGQGRVNALEELQEDEANRVSLRQELVAAGKRPRRFVQPSWLRKSTLWRIIARPVRIVVLNSVLSDT